MHVLMIGGSDAGISAGWKCQDWEHAIFPVMFKPSHLSSAGAKSVPLGCHQHRVQGPKSLPEHTAL
ncbi:MAG: hypothetical protein M3014_07400, partial [Chloroflexota bacterium]|nr:hypothetical protein [Chloroflexota bacterium]